jgi:uncharacterized membrane protein
MIDVTIGATVFGDVYDFSLEKQNNAIVAVNSTPKQIVVAKDGSYSFELPVGKYEISAKYLINNETISSVTEPLNVEKQGSFRLDLILFPSFEAEESILEETKLEVEDFEEKNYTNYIILGIAVAALALIIFLIIKYKELFKKLKKEEKELIEIDEEKKIIEFIKKQGGRTTQKDIRKHFPSSEAKISLALTELEEKGIVKKIKRGRGNIIFLQR